MRHGYRRWVMWVIIMSLLAGALAGCKSRASGGTVAAAEEGAVRATASVALPTSAPPTATPVPPTPTAEPAPVASSGDPLVYPGANQLEIPENAQADWLELLKHAELWSPPIGVPVGTPLIWYGTTDHKTLVRDYYAGTLPGDGWTLVHEWENPVMYLTQWSKGSDQLFLANQYDFMKAFIALQNEQYGLDMPMGDGTAIWVMLWKD